MNKQARTPPRRKLREACVIAGDIGGTHARFALFALEGTTPLYQRAVPSGSFSSFEAAFAEFLRGAPDLVPAAATFGIAGPIVDGRVRTTNLPWIVDARKLAAKFSLPRVTLVNDLVAIGIGALHGSPRKQVPIHLGRPKRRGGNIAVIAAGTGLGEALLVWDGSTHVPCASEGAHVEFGPRSPLERALLDELSAKHGHVSYERVASASVLHELYEFLGRRTRAREPRAVRRAIAEATDANAEIVRRALSGESELSRRTVEFWASMYGAEAGNLALKSLATAGVYVAGGLSSALADVLAHGFSNRSQSARGAHASAAEGPFLSAFLDKGRLRPVMERIPVAVVCDAGIGLRGAAVHAARTAKEGS